MSARRTSTTRSRASIAIAATGTARSIALEGNAADVLPELVRRRFIPDVVTDQTSAHDALERLRARTVCRSPKRSRCANPTRAVHRPLDDVDGQHVRAMLAFKRAGAVAFDYGNNIRAQATRVACRRV